MWIQISIVCCVHKKFETKRNSLRLYNHNEMPEMYTESYLSVENRRKTFCKMEIFALQSNKLQQHIPLFLQQNQYLIWKRSKKKKKEIVKSSRFTVIACIARKAFKSITRSKWFEAKCCRINENWNTYLFELVKSQRKKKTDSKERKIKYAIKKRYSIVFCQRRHWHWSGKYKDRKGIAAAAAYTVNVWRFLPLCIHSACSTDAITNNLITDFLPLSSKKPIFFFNSIIQTVAGIHKTH